MTTDRSSWWPDGKPFVVQNGKLIRLPRPANADCYDVGINEQAQIIGSCGFSPSHAFFWTLQR